MEASVLNHVNAMPAPTWHRLHMNEALVELPALSCARSVSVLERPEAWGAPDAFDAAFAALEGEPHEADGAPEGEGRSAEASADPLDQLALSASQIERELIEASPSPRRAFQTGMGSEAFAYLRRAAGAPLVVSTAPRQKGQSVSLLVKGVDGAANVAALDVVAAEGSELEVQVVFDSPEAGSGVVGSSLRLFVGPDAHVSVFFTQTLDDSWVALDDTGVFLGERARVDVRHNVLGAGSSYTGLAADLRGDSSRISVDTRYLGRNTQVRDFCYTMRHHGPRTESSMNANGVLSGMSEKTLRGTIDLIRGCKGASGGEAETVLLADERVINRSVPVILCGEDDVAGNHGGTIGHVRPDQRLYLQSRGLSAEAVEQLFLRATLEEAALTAPGEASRSAVARLGALCIDDFEEAIA